MSRSAITTRPVESNELPLFPDLEYHDRLERQNRILRWALAAASIVLIFEGAAVMRLAKAASEKVVEVIRINDVGKADAVAYANTEYRPEAPEIRYFLTEWARDRYARLRATVQTDFPKNYYFFDSSLTAALMQKDKKALAEFVAGRGEQNEVKVTNIHITNLQTLPHTADVYLTKIFYSSPTEESRRENWVIRVNFSVNPKTVKNELVPYNPLGLTINYFREDQAFQ